MAVALVPGPFEEQDAILRLLSDRHHNLTVLRIGTVCRLRALLRELIAGEGPFLPSAPRPLG